MRKSAYIKRFIALLLVVLMSINTFAAVVGDNDGAAFITKAEFDSMKNDFQSQLDRYNSSIDNKIDGAIASYLAGIKMQQTSTEKLLLWGGTRLGLLENVQSRPYVEGTVGGTINYALWGSNGGSSDNLWYYGYNYGTGKEGNTRPKYFSFCRHIFESSPEQFKYGMVECADNSENIFDLIGYVVAKEEINLNVFIRLWQDYTNNGRFLFGLCDGWVPSRFGVSSVLSDHDDVMGSLCETEQNRTNSRGANASSLHNKVEIKYNQAQFYTEFRKQSENSYLTNSGITASYIGLRESAWHGLNMHDDPTEPHTYAEFAKQGWTIPDGNLEKNFHLKTRITYGSEGDYLYGCYTGTWVRGITGDGSGAAYTHNPAYAHGQVPMSDNFKKLFKSDLGPAVTPANIYSSEIGNVIKDYMPDKVSTNVFNGISKTLAPLSIGLPIAVVRANDSVKLELDFLNAADYTVAFAVGGFNTEPIANTIGTDTGCVVKGSTNHMISITGPKTGEPITINVNKNGILFLKYSATGDNAQQINLPVDCVKTTND